MRRLLLALLTAACATAPVAPPAAPVVQAPPPPAWVRTPPPEALPSAKVAATAVTRKTLPNGVRLIVVEQHRRKVAIVNLLLPKGSLYDPPGDEGLTYMAVKLASDFHELGGARDENEKSFRMQVARLGGVTEFEVESDFSQIEISGYSQDIPTYLKLLSAELHRPRHGARSFHQRRNFTLDAVEDAESSDTASFRQLLNRTAFGPDHPYSAAPYGTVKGLSHLRLKDVESQQRFIFEPEGATLLVVGDVQPAEVIAKATELLSDWKTHVDPDADVVPLPKVPRPSLPRDSKQIQYLARPTASTMMTCATRPLPEVAATNATLRVLVAVLGEGLESRLNQTLRNDNGLTYGADAQVVRRRLASALIACSAIDSSRAAEGTRLFREVLGSLKDKPPSDEEIARAKGVVLSRIDSSMDDVQRSVDTWLLAIAYGDGSPHSEQERAAVQAVKASEVRDLAAKLFKLDNFRWVVSGDRAVAVKAFESTGLGTLAQAKPAK
ncbi:MAG TPA: pitrilysin family protein [Myxococcales bacterium]|nr:pitrilysin family protein [Myxococcales bacterium]